MNSVHKSLNTLKTQHGISTLLMSTVLIFVVSMISVYAAQVSVMEQKISSNHYRAKQAFEAAQSGLEIALSQLDFRALSTVITAANPSLDHTELTAAVGAVVGNKSTLKATSTSPTIGHYRLQLARIYGVNNNNILQFTAYGYPDDVTPSTNNSNANQTITLQLKKSKYVNYAPQATLVALGEVNLTGNDVDLTNITGDPMAVVWSSGAVSKSSGTTILVNNGTEVDSQNGLYVSDADLQAIDEIADINGRSEKMFQNFFAQSKGQLKNRATVVDCKSGCTHSDLAGLSGIVWVDAQTTAATYDADGNVITPASYNTLAISNSITLGSVTEPAVLIVNGNITINNPSANINGIIYTTRDFNNGTNSGSITGSLISEGNINIGGNFNITYNNDMLTNGLEDLAMYTRLPGSWIDI